MLVCREGDIHFIITFSKYFAVIRSFIATALSFGVAFFAVAQISNDWEDRKDEGFLVILNGERVPIIIFSSSAKNYGDWSLTFDFIKHAQTGSLEPLQLELTFAGKNVGWGICSLGNTGVLKAKRGFGGLYRKQYEREKTIKIVESPYYDNVFSVEKPLDFLRWLKEPLSGDQASSIKMRLTDGCGEKYEMLFSVNGEPFETVEEFKQLR